jgi:hypothetical protein
MRAVLVATRGADRVFYDLDSKPGSKDGFVVRPDGSSVPVNLISWAAKASGVNMIRDSKFHRFLWDAPQDVGSGRWFETFIKRSMPVDPKMLEDVNISSSLDADKEQPQKSKAVKIKSVDNGTFTKVIDYRGGKYLKKRFKVKGFKNGR